MNGNDKLEQSSNIMVELIHSLKSSDLNDLCDAAEAAIIDGGGFGWLAPPPRDVLEAYWKGVLLIPERDLLVGRLDGVIAGSCQVLRPCLLYTSDAADEEDSVDLGGRRIIKKNWIRCLSCCLLYTSPSPRD